MFTSEKYETRIDIGEVVFSIVTDDIEINQLINRKFERFLSKATAEIFIELQTKDVKKCRMEMEKEGWMMEKDNRLICTFEGFYIGMADLNQKRAYELLLFSQKEKIGDIIRNFIPYFLISFEGIFLHSASVVTSSNKAFLLCGDSGCGKSTIANLSENYLVIDDDTNLIRRVNGKYKVFSTPFNKMNGINTPFSAEIKAIFFPKKDTSVYIEKSSFYESLSIITRNVLFLWFFNELSPTFKKNLFTLYVDLILNIPCYDLHFLPDRSFWSHILQLEEKK